MAARESDHALLREPLFHFVLLAILIFVAHWATAEPEPAPVIAIDEQEVEEYRDNFEQRHFRQPTTEEVDRFRQNRINEEILYREGLALGLDREDPVIKARVISKMQLVMAEKPDLDDPGDKVLEAFLQQQPERYHRSARYSFALAHFPEADDSARATLARAVANGADPQRAGLTVEHFEGRNQASVAATFGPDFPQLLELTAENNRWQEVEVNDSTRLLRVTEYQPGTLPPLNQIRQQVLTDWRRAERVRKVDQQVAAMAEQYNIQH